MLEETKVNKFERLAAHLLEAENNKRGVSPLTALDPELSTKEAYQVQLHTIQSKVSEGRRIVGKKIGLTSKAMQNLLKVNEPDYGHLLDDMVIENHGEVTPDQVLQPRVEAELAFVLKKDLIGPNVTVLDVLQATDFIVPAIEIVDSRIQDWKITLQDTIGDNASSGLYILGERGVSVGECDLKQVGMALYRNGKLINTGVGAAALGDPAACVAWLANKMAEFGITLKAGEVILSGALSAAVDAKPGDYFQARFQNLGDVSVRFASEK